MTYWVQLHYNGKRVSFPTIGKARQQAIQMILKYNASQWIKGTGKFERQADIYSTKEGYYTNKGATTFVGSVVNYSGDFRWVHYFYKEGITLALSDELDWEGRITKKDPNTEKWRRYGTPKKIKYNVPPEPSDLIRRKKAKKKTQRKSAPFGL